MTWEWSHTDEAYANAQENVYSLSRKRLLEILREWAYHDRETKGTLRTRTNSKRVAGFRLPNGLARMPKDLLAENVWSRMSEFATCDNGGFNAYACPDGCHTVSFDLEGK